MLRVPVLIIVFFQVGERIIDLDTVKAVVKARGPFVETRWRASLQIMRTHVNAAFPHHQSRQRQHFDWHLSRSRWLWLLFIPRHLFYCRAVCMFECVGISYDNSLRLSFFFWQFQELNEHVAVLGFVISISPHWRNNALCHVGGSTDNNIDICFYLWAFL